MCLVCVLPAYYQLDGYMNASTSVAQCIRMPEVIGFRQLTLGNSLSEQFESKFSWCAQTMVRKMLFDLNRLIQFESTLSDARPNFSKSDRRKSVTSLTLFIEKIRAVNTQ